MAKFSNTTTAPPKAPVTTVSAAPDTRTHEGGPGWSREAKSELFLLAVTNLVTEKTFYEGGKGRDERFEQLIGQVAAEDPDWVARFVPFLRETMNMRSASVVMAAELVHAKLAYQARGAVPAYDWPTSTITNRTIIASALQRADEPAEMIGYWRGKWGKALPMPVKRGVADAVTRLYNERALLRYGAGGDLRMADVIEIVHPAPVAPWQSALFKYAIDQRHDHVGPEGDFAEVGGPLPTIVARRMLDLLPRDKRVADAAQFSEAGASWEWASAWYGRKLDAAFWEALIPSMGIFALVRNLRNFDDAGIGRAAGDAVIAKLEDREVVAKSRMFPLRFYAAYRETATLNWASALETAVDNSLANVPALRGKTLVMVDLSGSMTTGTLSARSKITRVEGATLFGAALAVRAEDATLVGFGSDSHEFEARSGGSVLRVAEKMVAENMGQTLTEKAVRKHLRDHDRVVIVTDAQSQDNPDAALADFRGNVYIFNVAGYRAGQVGLRPGRYEFGGLTDAGFTAIELLERGSNQTWPF